jgi:hypothetical protein
VPGSSTQVAWQRWYVLEAPRGEAIASATALGQNKDGRLELFAVDQNGAVWHRFQNNAGYWLAEWHPLGKPGPLGASSDTVVARNKDGRLELFAQASDHEVWHCWQRREGGWSPWKPLGAPVGGAWDLAVGAHADGRLVLFATAGAPHPPGGSPPHTELWWREQAISGGWSDWMSIGVVPAEDHRFIRRPTMALNADGRLELFGTAGKGSVGSVGLYWLRQTSPSGGDWEGDWVDLQSPPPPVR